MNFVKKYYIKFRFRIIFSFICLIILFTGCSKKQSSEKIFRFNEPNSIESLDPITANNYPAINVLINVCEGLVEYNKDAKLQPLIAKSYEISSDGITYTFHLRNDVNFHNDDCFQNKMGRKVSAKDFL